MLMNLDVRALSAAS